MIFSIFQRTAALKIKLPFSGNVTSKIMLFVIMNIDIVVSIYM